MTECYLHVFPGSEISLSLLSSKKHSSSEPQNNSLWTADALDALEVLRSIVEPLSAELTLTCFDKNTMLKLENLST